MPLWVCLKIIGYSRIHWFLICSPSHIAFLGDSFRYFQTNTDITWVILCHYSPIISPSHPHYISILTMSSLRSLYGWSNHSQTNPHPITYHYPIYRIEWNRMALNRIRSSRIRIQIRILIPIFILSYPPSTKEPHHHFVDSNWAGTISCLSCR